MKNIQQLYHHPSVYVIITMSKTNENTEQQMTSDGNILKEQLDVPVTPHHDQLEENLDDIVPGNEDLIIDSGNETNVNKEVEAVARRDKRWS